MNNLDTILSVFLNGEPLHDSIVIGIMFTIFYTFYTTCFNAVFSIFKR